jgi:hypothetical protein
MAQIKHATKRGNPRRNWPAPIQQFNDLVRLIEVAPNGSPGCFSATANGELVVLSSRQPLLDACRGLLDAGADPNGWVIMRHADSDTDCLRGKIGLLARLSVEDRPSGGKPPRFVPYRPMPDRAEGSPPMRQTELAYGVVP